MENKKDSNYIVSLDILVVCKKLWTNKRTLIITSIVGGIVGLALAFTSQNEYTAETIIVPVDQQSTGITGGLASIASMAGFNMSNMGSTELAPVLYPKIVYSYPFVDGLLKTYISSSEGDSIRVYDYILENGNSPLSTIKKYTVGLPGLLISKLKKENINVTLKSDLRSLSGEEVAAYKKLAKSIEILIKEDDGFIYISCTLCDALQAAELTEIISKRLQKEVIKIRIERATSTLEYLQKRYQVVKGDYESKQRELALYYDQNYSVKSNLAQINEEKLKSEFNLLQSVLDELANNIESAKLAVKKDTPIFTVLQPVIVPYEKSSLSKKMQIILWIILGFFFGIACIYWTEHFGKIKDKWMEL